MKDVYKRYEIDKPAKILLSTVVIMLIIGSLLLMFLENKIKILTHIGIISTGLFLPIYGHIIYTTRAYLQAKCTHCTAYLWKKKKTKKAFHLCPYCQKEEMIKIEPWN